MSLLIINPGGADDAAALPLYTRTRTWIPNEQARPFPPERMAAALDRVRKDFDATRVELRALDGSYNCVGLVFANRRTRIEPEHVGMILREDGYMRHASVDLGREGDVAVYRDRVTNEVTHVVFVAQVSPNLLGGSTRLRVLSQWGRDGEYLHDADAVPSKYGRLAEVWTYRYGVT